MVYLSRVLGFSFGYYQFLNLAILAALNLLVLIAADCRGGVAAACGLIAEDFIIVNFVIVIVPPNWPKGNAENWQIPHKRTVAVARVRFPLSSLGSFGQTLDKGSVLLRL